MDQRFSATTMDLSGGGRWSGIVPRAVSLYMPHWSVDLLLRRNRDPLRSADRLESAVRRRGDASSVVGSRAQNPLSPAGRRRNVPPILLYTTTAGRQIVVRRCEQAAAAGVCETMTLAHARALLPHNNVLVKPHQPHRELMALKALARWALRFSPIVAVDPPDGVLIDIAGCERLFHGERQLLTAITTAVARLGFQNRLASASTFACAWAIARFGSPDQFIVPHANERKALEPLPIAALRVDQATIEGLREVGIDRIGHLLKLPRSSLGARFGAPLLGRLDQAMGKAAETIDPVRPVEPPMVERIFAGPTTQLEAIQLAVRELLEELSEHLQQRECGVRQLELRFDRIDAPPIRETITLSRPSRDAKHLWSLLGPKVESINLGYGVERVALTAQRWVRLSHVQMKQWGSDAEAAGNVERDVGALVDALANRLGSDRIMRAEPIETHVPERAFRYCAVMEEQRHEATPQCLAASQRRARGERDEGIIDADRPAVLLQRPEPITVMALTPDGPPARLRWRGMEQRITASAGPERIAPEWWHLAPGEYTGGKNNEVGARDYFKVQDERGCWLWVYRVIETGRWFIHGLWA